MKKLLWTSLTVIACLSGNAFATNAGVIAKAQQDIATIEAAGSAGKITSQQESSLIGMDNSIEQLAMLKHGSVGPGALMLSLADNQMVFQSDKGFTGVVNAYSVGKLTQTQEYQLENSYTAISQEAQTAARAELKTLHIELEETNQIVKMDEGK